MKPFTNTSLPKNGREDSYTSTCVTKTKPIGSVMGLPIIEPASPNRRDIDDRPVAANKRERVGDWEADTIIGNQHKGAIVTLDERKTKVRLAAPLPGKKAVYVTEAITRLLGPIKSFVKTITFDNGREFTQLKKIADAAECETFFAKPYHSWERGQNENANGLLRQYFPKKMKLHDVSMH
jgi:IS30 family transposase